MTHIIRQSILQKNGLNIRRELVHCPLNSASEIWFDNELVFLCLGLIKGRHLYNEFVYRFEIIVIITCFPIVFKYINYLTVSVKVMVFNATFNNISVLSWQSVLLVVETGENHRPAASH